MTALFATSAFLRSWRTARAARNADRISSEGASLRLDDRVTGPRSCSCSHARGSAAAPLQFTGPGAEPKSKYGDFALHAEFNESCDRALTVARLDVK